MTQKIGKKFAAHLVVVPFLLLLSLLPLPHRLRDEDVPPRGPRPRRIQDRLSSIKRENARVRSQDSGKVRMEK